MTESKAKCVEGAAGLTPIVDWIDEVEDLSSGCDDFSYLGRLS